MKFDKDFIDKVREHNNILDIVSQYTELKPAGGEHKGCCPLPGHTEKTPSFMVNDRKSVYHCFGCNQSGDLFDFVQLMKGMSFPETVEYLADRGGLPIPEDLKEYKPSPDRGKKRSMHKINEVAAEFFHKNLLGLPTDHRARIYLAKRGFTPEVIKRFQLGYAPDDWETLTSHLKHQKMALGLAAEVGLVKERTNGKFGYFDIFRHRLMFPIWSAAGDCIGFGGRVLGDEQPKYMNSPDSLVFHKGKNFYGINDTAKFIRSQDAAIVVEGYTDFLALYQAGINNLVAGLGTAFTEDHARVLHRLTQNVVILFDGDEAGKKAAARSLPILLKQGVIPRILILTEDLDPDDFIKKFGKDEIRKKIEQAPEMFSTLIRESRLNVPPGAAGIVKMLDVYGPILLSIPDRRLKSLYAEEFAAVLGKDVQWLREHLKPQAKRSDASSIGAEETESTEAKSEVKGRSEKAISIGPKAPKAELYLLNLALMEEEYLSDILEHRDLEYVTDPGVRQALELMLRKYRQMPNKFDSLSALLVAEVEPATSVSLYLKPPLVGLKKQEALKMIGECRRRIRQVYYKHRHRQLASSLMAQDSEDQKQKLEQIMNIHRDRHSLDSQ